MPKKMVAVRKISHGKGLVVDEIPVPKVRDDEVLVAIEAASLCGTDLHIWEWDEWSSQRIKTPLTIGHEFAGTVVQIGTSVQHVSVGDYVSAESHITCGMCFQCRTGQLHMCPKTRILGVDRDGAFAEYIALPEKVIWPNDRTKLPPEIATLQEPFGNGIFATLAHDIAGQSVGVLGCGPVGLFSVAIAKASGAALVLAVDLNDFRLNLAKKMGADATLNARNVEEGDIVNWLADANEGYGVDIVLEMSGAPSAIDSAFRGVRNGGRITLFGIPSSPVRIDVAESMIFKNLTVLALNGRRIFDTWYKTRWMMESGVVNLKPLITHEMGMDKIEEAMQLLANGDACKIILRPNTGMDIQTEKSSSIDLQDPNIHGRVMHR